MSQKFRSPGEVLTLTAPSGGVASGVPVVIGSHFCIPEETALVGVSFAGRVEGEVELPKTASQAIAEGDDLYWDAATAKLDNTGTIGVKVGVCSKAALSADTTVYCKLNGTDAKRGLRVGYAAVAAAGSVQGDAAALSDGFNKVSAADGTKGVLLPTAAPGSVVLVKNNVNAVLKVYPKTGGTINAIAANGAISMAALTSAAFMSDGTGWFTLSLLPS